MKKKITKIWGVGLILMMVVSLLLWTAPAMAGNTMEWDDESIPDSDDFVILVNEHVVTLAVSEGGLAIFAGTGNSVGTIYVSTDKGVTWDDSAAPEGEGVDVDLIAVSPDDPRYIAVADATSTEVIISDDGGATFDSLGLVDATLSDYATLLDVAVSRESGDNRWIAVASDNGSGVGIAYYEIGAIGAAWTEISSGDMGSAFTAGENDAAALAFSPNFHSDEIMIAVTANSSSNTVDFQMFSFNQEEWNADAGFDDFPVDILDGTSDTFTTADALDVALGPDYLGSDGDMRIAFVGTATNLENETSGIFRLEDDDVEVLKDEKAINSVAFDGVNLLAGRYDATDVYRSADPLASSPDVSGSKSYKHPGGADKVIVGWAGDVAVAATQGNGSGFSVSQNDGKTFNDISLIDTTLSTLSDVALSADGEMLYLVTHDNDHDNLSVWRLFDDAWERVFFEDNTTTADSDYILRIAPDDQSVIFMADVDGTNIFYSTDSGDSRWYTRSSRYDIADLAVETTGEVLYVLENNANACYVSKSTNTGFTWGSKETTGLADGDGTIVSLGEDLLIVGSIDGTVSYSTDGNDSWTDLEDKMGTGELVQVTAQGLADGDFIFAAQAKTNGSIYRWELGEDDSWDDFFDMTDSYSATGIALDSGGKILYVLATNGTDSRLYRTDDATKSSPTVKDATTSTGEDFNSTPSALRMTSGSNVLWAIDTDTPELFSLEDTVVTAVPVLRSPPAGFTVHVNEVSGNLNNVSLIWESPSDDVYEFDYEVAFDSDFDEILSSDTETAAGPWDEGDTHAEVLLGTSLIPDTTYYWRVRVDEPFRSGWAEASFKVGAAEARPPVTVEIPPAPDITVEMPAPEVTVTIPPVVQVPPAPAPTAGWALVTMIVLGAILVVALIVLILRTRRVV